MSALPPKADVGNVVAVCPLMTQSGPECSYRSPMIGYADLRLRLPGPVVVYVVRTFPTPCTVLSNSASSVANSPSYYLFNLVIFVPCSPRPAIKPF